MANIKITDLTEDTTPANNDWIETVDVSAGANKKVTRTNFFKNPPLADDSITEAMLYLPHFWPEIARTTLSVAGDTITVSSIPARKYLLFLVYANASGGTLDCTVRFNNDSGSNYAIKYSVDYAAPTAIVSHTSFPWEYGATDSGGISSGKIEVIANITAEEKNFTWRSISQDAAGAATQAAMVDGFGKWVNTSAQINRIDLINGGTGTGDFDAGSEIIVLGHD